MNVVMMHRLKEKYTELSEAKYRYSSPTAVQNFQVEVKISARCCCN
jgi:hypothetical protein